MPWVITVAAGTAPTPLVATLSLAGTNYSANFTGVSVSLAGLPVAAPVVYPGSGQPFVPGSKALCAPGSLTDDVAGKIVVCMRGIYGRTQKSQEVARAGGVG